MPALTPNAISYFGKSGLPPARVDSIEACSHVYIDKARVREPLPYGVNRLRMVMLGREHIERAQDFNPLEFFVSEIEFRFV